MRDAISCYSTCHSGRRRDVKRHRIDISIWLQLTTQCTPTVTRVWTLIPGIQETRGGSDNLAEGSNPSLCQNLPLRGGVSGNGEHQIDIYHPFAVVSANSHFARTLAVVGCDGGVTVLVGGRRLSGWSVCDELIGRDQFHSH